MNKHGFRLVRNEPSGQTQPRNSTSSASEIFPYPRPPTPDFSLIKALILRDNSTRLIAACLSLGLSFQPDHVKSRAPVPVPSGAAH